MSAAWTAEQVAALAPDPGSAKAGQGLAAPARWVTTGRDERALWGECSGSGAKPYQVAVDSAGPAFKCSCPSRKFPCKHALGLLFMNARGSAIPQSAPPDWVAEWIAGRQEKAEKQAARAAAPPAEKAPDPEAQAKRAARREERVAAGMEELERWLEDLVRQGLAALTTKPPSFWETPAARLVDAQAPGAARLVRQLSPVAHSGEGWPERMLERLSRLHLLAEAYARIDTLPEPAREDVRAALGFTLRQEELTGEGVRDRWAVLGQRIEEEDRLTVRRTWLRGGETGRAALLLAFSAARQPLEPGPPPGTIVEAELAFYPGAAPLRALFRGPPGEPRPLRAISGHATVGEAMAAYADALARNPWTDRFPLALSAVVPVRDGADWLLRDEGGAVVPLDPAASAAGWPLVAMGGGAAIGVFGEWDGDGLYPLSASAGGRFVPLVPRFLGGIE